MEKLGFNVHIKDREGLSEQQKWKGVSAGSSQCEVWRQDCQELSG